MKIQKSFICFPSLLQRFFCDRLISQQNVSTKTVASYRDTFRLLLKYLNTKLHKHPSEISFDDLNTQNILSFLNYLEIDRKNTVRTRNTRLAAIRSFLQFSSYYAPDNLSTIQSVLAIPMKRYNRHVVGYLSQDEVNAIINAPDISTWSGKRDMVLFTTLYNTGARVSEIISVKVSDIYYGRTMNIKIQGKGRKERVVPLWKKTSNCLKKWLMEIDNSPEKPLFPNSLGRLLSRSGVEYRLKLAVKIASKKYPFLKKRKISPHTFRHTTAMHLLQAGVDITVIAIWLGHESPVTTHMYIEADLLMKERALSKLNETKNRQLRYKPKDKLLEFLEML